jgi:hypothetical protein
VEAAAEARRRIDHLKKGLDDTPGADAELMRTARDIEARLQDLQVRLSGDSTKSKRSEPAPPSITDRVGRIIGGQWTSSSAPTSTNRDAYRYAGEEFATVLADLRRLIEVDLHDLERAAESLGAPWTPGRVPVWSIE